MDENKNIKIMVADDIDIIRENICDFLSEEPNLEIVGQSATAEEIIAQALEKDVDVILMDIEMENKISGIYAAEVILNSKPNVKIIFMSVHEGDDVIIRALETGAVDYLIKTDDKEKIIRHIRRAYIDRTEIDHDVLVKMRNEFKRLRKSENALMYFIKNIAVLTPAERELLKLLLEGKKLSQIASERCVELVTVKTQINHLLKKFGVRRTKEIVKMIREMKLENLFM